MIKLYKHQEDAVSFLEKNNFCGAIFHDCGLGKTITILQAFKKLKSKKPDIRMLVFCPKNLIYNAWQEDNNKHGNFTFCGDINKYKGQDILAVNYELVIRREKIIDDLLKSFEWFVVLDESTKIKNPKSKITKTCIKKIAPAVQHRVVMSGTPMPNTELDLYYQLDFVRKGILGYSYYGYRNKYFFLQRGNSTINNSLLSFQAQTEYLRKGFKYATNADNRKRIMESVSHAVQWVKKEDAVDLPEKINHIRHIELSSPVKKYYTEMKNELVIELEKEDIAAPYAISKLMKLRQITSGFIYSEEKTHYLSKRVDKLEALDTILEETANKQKIIYFNFKAEKNTLQEYLKEYIIDVLDGETKDREEVISNFKSGKTDILLAHTHSTAHGLTFTNCDTIIYFSLDYSNEAHSQSIDRIHRIGQKNICNYYYILAKGTIDDVIFKALKEKKKINELAYEYLKGR